MNSFVPFLSKCLCGLEFMVDLKQTLEIFRFHSSLIGLFDPNTYNIYDVRTSNMLQFLQLTNAHQLLQPVGFEKSK